MSTVFLTWRESMTVGLGTTNDVSHDAFGSIKVSWADSQLNKYENILAYWQFFSHGVWEDWGQNDKPMDGQTDVPPDDILLDYCETVLFSAREKVHSDLTKIEPS